jgi:hypothetical protein
MEREPSNPISDCPMRIPLARKLPFGLGCLCILAGLGLVGCGYTVGPAFSPCVRTVSVPIFKSDLFRRGIEFQLTEAVQKEIKLRGLRIAEAPYAETRLSGQIFSYEKQLLSESAFDDGRELQLSLAVMVTWEDLRTGEILNQQEISLPPEAIALTSTADFAPEVGQSLASANQQLVDRIARDIVNKMEMPW